MDRPRTAPAVSDRVECVVVGGGLAGLACAHRLARAGRSVGVVEADANLGGRAQTDWFEGRPVDRGFQALFRAYPETRRFIAEIGLPRRDLRPFWRGAMIHDGERWARPADRSSAAPPWRRSSPTRRGGGSPPCA